MANFSIDDVSEITVKYKDGKIIRYKDKTLDEFVRSVLDSYEFSEEEPVTVTKEYTNMSLEYKREKNKSPAELAREMQRQATKVLKF